MAVESFTELLHKLKEVHEQELEGLQQKVLELTNKKNCDAKRLEELYNRNQQLREQHKILTENIKQLENMLRAGLCDRCTVTQEMAKKRQQEYESSHLQSLQHISIMVGEINTLMKENERLKEEVKSLRRRIEQQNGHSERAGSPEVKHSPDLTATSLSMASSVLKNDHSAPGGAITTAAIVKHEPEHNQSLETPGDRQETSDKEHKRLQGWSLTHLLESSRQPTFATNQTAWKERRAVSMDSLETRPSPTSPSIPLHLRLLKHNPLFSPRHSEDRPALVSVPLRPHPIKTTPSNLPWPLPERSDWVSVVNTGTSGGVVVSPNPKHDSGSPVLRFSSLVPPGLESHLPSRSPAHPRPICPYPKNLLEATDTKEKRTPPSSWTSSQYERIFGENLREGDEEAPLDLSNASPKVKETEMNSVSSSSPPAPLSSPSSAQYASSPQSDLQTGDTKLQREETGERHNNEVGEEGSEKNENVDTENLKIPTLTISLRPVVVLESLKSTGQLQKEQDMERDSSPKDQDEKEDSKQVIVKKRPGQTFEAFPWCPLKEKKLRTTLLPQGTNHGDSEQD
ncbi:uncharacterized protein rbbp8l [Neoarius graeffei]|uniref:uncharacterized protein rbbp8l n=1 Tax=Neoarius graeffei TaxID=443677 RepID=UPI00298BD3F7|nr:uncharacterized protein rbbp8l [Neoarius graeffei]